MPLTTLSYSSHCNSNNLAPHSKHKHYKEAVVACYEVLTFRHELSKVHEIFDGAVEL